MGKIVVTGANGYIGRNFIKYAINKGIEVYAVDINHSNSKLKDLLNIHFIECDMKHIDQLVDIIPKQEYIAFYHFAWNGVGSSNNNRKNYEIQIDNIKYACNAALISKKLNCKKFITTGSIVEKAVNQISESVNVTESFYYGIAKNCLNTYLKTICKINNINYIWAILPNIYGGDSEGTIISYMFKEYMHGRIPIFGPCQQPYNFTYIKDVVRALLFIGMHYSNSSEYLLSNGECRKMYMYLDEVAQILSKEIKIGVRKDDGLVFEEKWFDNYELIKLGFIPKYSFIDGIKDYLNEMENRPNDN